VLAKVNKCIVLETVNGFTPQQHEQDYEEKLDGYIFIVNVIVMNSGHFTHTAKTNVYLL
jgi:hypothetical protein